MQSENKANDFIEYVGPSQNVIDKLSNNPNHKSDDANANASIQAAMMFMRGE